MLFFYPQFASTRPSNWEQNGTHAKKKICLSLCEKNIIEITKNRMGNQKFFKGFGLVLFYILQHMGKFCEVIDGKWTKQLFFLLLLVCLFSYVHTREFVPLEKVIKRDSPCFSWDQKLSVQCLTKYYSLQAHSIQLPKIISLSLTSSLSWKIFLLSECPMITQLQPMSLIIAGLKWIFNIWLLLQTLDMKYVLSTPIHYTNCISDMINFMNDEIIAVIRTVWYAVHYIKAWKVKNVM